jgi:hypothetical protein
MTKLARAFDLFNLGAFSGVDIYLLHVLNEREPSKSGGNQLLNLAN